MDTVIQDQISKRLFTIGEVLKDVEFDMEWEHHQLLTFSIEWADVCGQVKRLRESCSQMNDEQRQSFDELKQRFEAVADRLKALELNNPFT